MKPEILLNDKTGRILHYPQWNEDWFNLFNSLKQKVDWKSRDLTMFGKQFLIPRLEAWVGDPGMRYCYSGKEYIAECWPLPLRSVISRLEDEFQWRPNAALLNRYRNGGDSVSFHADDERELGSNPTIAILSLGGARNLSFKPKSGCAKNFKVCLLPGSLLWMDGALQTHWLHAINKVKSAEERISCTFRQILV
ncbi:MAG: alpha-ketoglutarate-dependent dioxygenase AlkB [Reinekea sp.]